LPHEHPKLGAIATANLTGHDFATFVLNLHMRKERMAHGESMHSGSSSGHWRSWSRTPLCGGYKEHGDPLEAVGARARSDGHNRTDHALSILVASRRLSLSCPYARQRTADLTTARAVRMPDV
jgi:hypothetical protein